jgi:hypothetical protein
MLKSKDAKPVKLAGQQTRARANRRSRNYKHQHALTGHPSITVFQEYQFHPLVTVWPKLVVIRRVKIQERAGFRCHSALKRTAVDGANAITVGGFGAFGVEFDASQVSASILGDLKQCRTVTGARINGRVGRGECEQGADVSGFLDR